MILDTGMFELRQALTRLAALGPLARSAGEGGPGPQGRVGEGNALRVNTLRSGASSDG
jgi:hypothetical protein